MTRLSTLAQQAEFLRTVCPPSSTVLAAAYDAGLELRKSTPRFFINGRFELPRWLREQAVSEDAASIRAID